MDTGWRTVVARARLGCASNAAGPKLHTDRLEVYGIYYTRCGYQECRYISPPLARILRRLPDGPSPPVTLPSDPLNLAQSPMGYRRETMNEQPRDLIGEIIGSIDSTAPGNRSDPLICALVNRSWRRHSQKRLVSSVRLEDRDRLKK